VASDDLMTRLSPHLAPLRSRLAEGRRDARSWLAEPANVRRAARVLLPVLVVLGLVLPPVSLWTRLTTLDFTTLTPGVDASTAAPGTPGAFSVRGTAIDSPARVRLRRDDGAANSLPPLPAGHRVVSDYYRLDVVGPAPRAGRLEAPVSVTEGEHPFVDGYGWDGQRWRWLAPQFSGTDRLRLLVPLDTFVPRVIVATLAEAASTQVSAVLLPPPATVPAAMAELPILEMRAYHLTHDDGSVSGRKFSIPSRTAKVYGVIDNLEGNRLRTDLVNNLLIEPAARQRHRDAITALARRDKLDGVVLDYRGIDTDLQTVYAGFLSRLAEDLHAQGTELVVTVPMPRQTADGWDPSPYNWRTLGAAVDGLRIILPNDTPLEVTTLDSLVQWSLGYVERGRLQLSVPVQGRDVVEDQVTPIGYGEALGRILDIAASDAPERITPGTSTTVDLPSVRQAELARDPATNMWRFHYWDANRRQHTVWLNDAAGLQPAFEIAARYRLGRVVLDGVSAGLDAGLWQMVKGFITKNVASAPSTAYRLQWQLTDAAGHVVQEAIQPLDASSFAFQAPAAAGDYRLGVNLVTSGDHLAAIGGVSAVQVAEPPPPTPRPTDLVIRIEATPEAVVTAPPPRDEANARPPVRVGEALATPETDYNAVVTFAEGQLRQAPEFGAPVVADLRVGDRLLVLNRVPDGGWLYARHSATGVEGWVRVEIVTLQTPIDQVPLVATEGAATATPGLAPTRPPSSARPTP
jgi:hypothetical protein